MDLTRAGAQYMGVVVVLIELLFKGVAIYAMLTLVKALKV